jgi:site-specific DNA-methyltransferase (adenine-specific)
MSWEIRQGDCLEGMATLEAESCHLIATDPPYGAGKGFAGDRNPAEAFSLISGLLPEFARLLVPGGCLYLFCDWRIYARLELAVREVLDWRDTIIWAYRWTRHNPQTWVRSYQQILFATKGQPAFWGAPRVAATALTTEFCGRLLAGHIDDDGVCRDEAALNTGRPGLTAIQETGQGGRRSLDTRTAPARNWWEDIDIVRGGMMNRDEPRQHPTQKPVKLMERIVAASCPEGGLVLDPFCGSGSTGVACVNLGRDFLGFEIDEGHCKLARRRLNAAQSPLPLEAP